MDTVLFDKAMVGQSRLRETALLGWDNVNGDQFYVIEEGKSPARRVQQGTGRKPHARNRDP
jgi:hypothetical protein